MHGINVITLKGENESYVLEISGRSSRREGGFWSGCKRGSKFGAEMGRDKSWWRWGFLEQFPGTEGKCEGTLQQRVGPREGRKTMVGVVLTVRVLILLSYSHLLSIKHLFPWKNLFYPELSILSFFVLLVIYSPRLQHSDIAVTMGVEMGLRAMSFHNTRPYPYQNKQENWQVRYSFRKELVCPFIKAHK